MDIKEQLTALVSRVFGPVEIGDHFTVDEIVERDKESNRIRVINVYLLKHSKNPCPLLDAPAFGKVVEAVKAVAGECERIRVSSAESSERLYAGGIKKTEDGSEAEFVEGIVPRFSYKFIVSLRKFAGLED